MEAVALHKREEVTHYYIYYLLNSLLSTKNGYIPKYRKILAYTYVMLGITIMPVFRCTMGVCSGYDKLTSGKQLEM